MNTNDITPLLERFRTSALTRSECEQLYRAFLNDPALTRTYPTDARIVQPIALAYFSQKGSRRLPSHRISSPHGRRVAIAASILLLMATGLVLLTLQPPSGTKYYCSQPMSNQEIEQWLTNTLATAV